MAEGEMDPDFSLVAVHVVGRERPADLDPLAMALGPLQLAIAPLGGASSPQEGPAIPNMTAISMATFDLNDPSMVLPRCFHDDGSREAYSAAATGRPKTMRIAERTPIRHRDDSVAALGDADVAPVFPGHFTESDGWTRDPRESPGNPTSDAEFSRARRRQQVRGVVRPGDPERDGGRDERTGHQRGRRPSNAQGPAGAGAEDRPRARAP